MLARAPKTGLARTAAASAIAAHGKIPASLAAIIAFLRPDQRRLALCEPDGLVVRCVNIRCVSPTSGEPMARVFLILAGLIWFAYGIYMLLAPETLAVTAGVSATNTTGTIELRAMYGGLEAAVGVLALIGGLVPDLRRAGLAALAFVCTGMGAARLGSALIVGAFSSYTIQGLLLESSLAIVAIWLFVREMRAVRRT